MKVTAVLYKAIFDPLAVISSDHVKGRISASVLTVIATALFGSVIAPVVYFYENVGQYENNLNIENLIICFTVSIATWLAVCLLFWFFSVAFKKKIEFRQVVSTWGLSYIPNFLCVILFYLLLICPEINSGSRFSTFIVSTLFIMLLVWKAIYYFMFMRVVMGTTLFEILAVTAISSVVFIFLSILGFRIGIQVPML